MINNNATKWSRALVLFDIVSGLDTANRQVWIESLPSSDLATIPLLKQLLSAHQKAETDDLLSTLPAQNEASLLNDNFAAGHRVGPFELIDRLGEGGMGSVWRARYCDGRLQREVAIKLPRIARFGGSERVVERMERERDVLTPLSHPNIARLLDAGVDAVGQLYLALELVKGSAIDTWADEQQLTIAERVRLMCKVLEAVDYAHHNLVLHRDIKPANIIVDATGIPKLLDFGVAKLLPAGGYEDNPTLEPFADLTQIESPALTLAFAAPEQVRRSTLTTATDVYACGVLLYKLLTGSLPHQPRRHTRAALEETILCTEPSLASRRLTQLSTAAARKATPNEIKRALQGDLDTILQKCLKLDMAQRYSTAAAMAEDLKRYLNRQPILARADSTWYVLNRFVSRHRLAVSISAIGIFFLAALTAFALWQAHLAQANAVRAEKASARNAAAQQFFAGLFASADPEHNKHISPLDRQIIDRAFDTAQKQFGAEPELLTAILRDIGDVYQRLGDLPTELKVRTLAAKIADANPAMDSDLRARALTEYGWSLTENTSASSNDEGLHRLSMAVEYALNQHNHVNFEEQVRAQLAYADGLRMRSRNVDALKAAQAALIMAQSKLSANHPLLALAHKSVAKFASDLGDFAHARQEYRNAVAVERNSADRNKVAQVQTLIHWSQTEFEAAQYADAAGLAKQALELTDHQLGDVGGQVLLAKMILIAAYERRGDLTQAQESIDRWLKIDLNSEDAFRSGRAHYVAGSVALTRSDFSTATSHFDIAADKLANKNRWLARVNALRASVLLKSNSTHNEPALDTALQLATSATQIYRTYAPDSRDHARVGQRLAMALMRSGRTAEAKSQLDQSCAWVIHNLTSNHPDRLRCAVMKAWIEFVLEPASVGVQRKQMSEAKQLLEQQGLSAMPLVSQIAGIHAKLSAQGESDAIVFAYFDP